MVGNLIDFIISVFKETQVNTWIIIGILILGYLYREGIRNFFSEKLLEKQKLHDEQRDVKQNEFQEKLLKQNAELQKSVLVAIENQKKEIQKELKEFDYERDYHKKIVDRRLDAYNELVKYLNELTIRGIITNDRDKINPNTDKFSIYLCFTDINILGKMISEGINVFKYNIWFSEDITDGLNKINDILNAVHLIVTSQKLDVIDTEYYGFNLAGMPVNQLINFLGIESSKDINLQIKKINYVINKDIKTMYDVKTFFDTDNDAIGT